MKVFNSLVLTLVLAIITSFNVFGQLPAGSLSTPHQNLCNNASVVTDTIIVTITGGTAPWIVTYQRVKNNVTDVIVDTINTSPAVYVDTLSLGANTYTIQSITDAGSQVGTDLGNPLTITLHALPNVVANSTANIVCQGTSITLSGSGASTYVWDNSIVNGQAFVPSATTTYNVTGTDANSCTNTSQIAITVNNLPVVSASSTANTVCQGASITLTGNGANTYVWDNSVVNGQAFVPSATTTYHVTGTDANSCTNTSQIAITVNNLPVVSANSTANTVCQGASITLTGNGASTYVWDNSVVNGQAFIIAATTTYHVTGTDANNCSNTSQITVTAHSIPVVNVSVDATTIPLTNPATSTTTTFNFTGAQPWTISGVQTASGYSAQFDTTVTSNPFTITSALPYGVNSLVVTHVSDANCSNMGNVGGVSEVTVTVTDNVAPVGGALVYTLTSNNTPVTVNPVSNVYDLGNINFIDALASLNIVVTDLQINTGNAVSLYHNGVVVGTFNYNQGLSKWVLTTNSSFSFNPGLQFCTAQFSDLASPANSTTLTLKFNIISNDATLSNITVNGTTITGFSSSTLNYDYFVINGENRIQPVTATATNSSATVAISNPTAPLTNNAITNIVVTAPDGITTKTYKVTFKYLAKVAVDVTSQDTVITVCTRNTLKIIVRYTGSYPFTVKWESKRNNTFSTITRTNLYRLSDTLVLNNVMSPDSVVCTVSNTTKGLNNSTFIATIKTNPSPKIKLDDVASACGKISISCLDTTVTTGYKYTWKSSGSTITFNNPFASNPNAYVSSITNSTTATNILIDKSGTYYVTVTLGTCSKIDSSVANMHPLPTISLGVDTNICGGDSLKLDANAGYTYQWSTGANTQSIYAKKKGTYAVTITDNFGCINSDSKFIRVSPEVDLGIDRSVYKGQVLVLGVVPTQSHLWSTGETTNSIAINTENMAAGTTYTYWVKADSATCSNRDTISIYLNFGINVDEINHSNNVKVYPNPTNGSINLLMTELAESNIEVTVYDAIGNVISNESHTSVNKNFEKQLDLSNLSKGVYYIKIKNNNKYNLEKVILQ